MRIWKVKEITLETGQFYMYIMYVQCSQAPLKY